MHHLVRVVVAVVGCVAMTLHAQEVRSFAPVTRDSTPRSYPVHASELLWQREAELHAYLAAHPDADLRNHLSKQAAWGFTVGSTKSWYASDLTTGGTQYLVPSTCRAVGTHCYVFAENANWGTHITQAIVDSVRNAFDLRTPADPAKGIYQTDVDAFGTPPDVDNDPRIIILIMDIKDGYAGSGGYIAGYFYDLNETGQPGSNHAEIYYLDANPQNLTTAGGLQEGLSTTAHEFQHMIHYNYDPYEITFINEGCSLVAEVNAGYAIYPQSGFVGETNHSLFDWRRNDNTAVLKDYSRAARFMTYVRDQFGMGFFKKLVASTLTGQAGMTAAMQQSGVTWSFSDLVQNFAIANIVNDKTVDPKYAYVYPSIVKAAGTTLSTPSYSATDLIQPYAAMYLKFVAGSNLTAKFTIDPNLVVKALELGTSSKRLLDMTSGTQFTETGFGSLYPEIDVVVVNRDANAHSVTSVIGSGVTTVEMKYEISEPTGYLALDPGDTVCVTFDGTPGAKLDSVRVALRRVGPITGGVWVSTGTQRPIGAPLAVPFTATAAGPAPTYPYPVPYPNWATVDLRSLHIDASNPFAVTFNSIGDPTVNQRVMTSEYPSASAYHNFTYLTNLGGSPDWYVLGAGTATDTQYVYHVHAYVSFGATGVRKPAELLPTTTALLQNYPNPFNPSTTIRFTLEKRQLVSLKIYDVLGRVAAVLVDEELPAGTYARTWNAGAFPSGVYFSRMTAGPVTETRRIMLTK